MSGQEGRARIRARVGAATVVWTLTELESDAERIDRDGPHIDHLAQLLRRQRRRRALRRGVRWWGDEQIEAQWGWLSDGDVRRMLTAREVEDRTDSADLDRGLGAGRGRGASSALGALPRQTGHREEREPDDRRAVRPPGR